MRRIVPLIALALSLAACGTEDGVASRGEPVRVPSPLFGEVEQLVPDPLPDGWVRCSGGPSSHPAATADWWSQTFGPTSDDGCQPLITVTQIPLGQAGFDAPEDAEDGKVAGDADAVRWSDAESGSVGLLTWASDQNLVVEGCCGPEALDHFDDLAGAALIATRDVAPPDCTDPASDLSAESLVENLTAKTSRMFADDGCPLRSDVASMETLPDDHHCWPGLTILVIGTPIGASTGDTEPRVYVLDPGGQLTSGGPDAALDLDATLSEDADQGGYVQGGRTVWIDEADDSVVFVVDGDSVETWPRFDKPLACR